MSKNVINWLSLAVRSDDTNSEEIWNKAETMAKVEADLDVFLKLQSADRTKINETLLSMFAGDKAKVSYNGAALVGVIMAEIGYDAQNYSALRARVEEVISENKRVFSSRGPGGGTRYMSPEEYEEFEKTGLNPAETLLAQKEEIKEKLKALKAATKGR